VPDLTKLKSANAKRWVDARLTRDFSTIARHLIALDAKERYQVVSAKTGVPWFVIAVIHERESSQDWTGSLAQGDPWNRVSVHIPASRGPFISWEEAAIDALVDCAPYVARNTDWSIGGTLTRLEEYNGLGYASRDVASPYLWAGTDQYRSGKYIRDSVYDPNAVDVQPGCAGLLLAMMTLDPTVRLGANLPAGVVPSSPRNTAPTDVSKPTLSSPAKGSIGAAIASLLSVVLATFKRK
jgi:lysozyme family protein